MVEACHRVSCLKTGNFKKKSTELESLINLIAMFLRGREV